jgi:hypothetical protein
VQLTQSQPVLARGPGARGQDHRRRGRAKGRKKPRHTPRKYGKDVFVPPQRIWLICGSIYGKRLAPYRAKSASTPIA